MTLGTRIYTWLRGELVGSDALGNKYYRSRGGGRSTIGFDREKRWVIYKDGYAFFGTLPDSSRVPPEWHKWLHHMAEDPPTDGEATALAWQKPHVPNPTGSGEAYRPPGHTLQGGRRDRATGDYEPWRPG